MVSDLISIIIEKVRRKLTKMRLQPIRVFCFHHISDAFDESTMKNGDWLQTDAFILAIEKLLYEGYSFISLPEAQEKLSHDIFRWHKYAVLTADDGWASMRNILPWLNQQQIPVTLFLNPAYLDGKHFRERATEQYLNEKEVKQLYLHYPLVTIGSHGWEHIDFHKQSDSEFSHSIIAAKEYLQTLPNYILFFAFPYGDYSPRHVNIVRSHHLVPLTVLGGKNYCKSDYIDRELL